MLAHAASSSALPCPLVSRPVSRQSRLETLVFPGKTGGFAAEVVGFELVAMKAMFCMTVGIPSRFARIARKKVATSPVEGR
jgi:hypothetical protein